jgi:hypothetical protein
MPRESDRWITPRVVAWMLLLATLVILAVIASVTFLTVRGLDPDPMLRLVAQVSAAVFSAGTFVQGLINRRTTTNVQKQAGLLATSTGQLATDVQYTLDELEAQVAARLQAAEAAQAAPAAAEEDLTRPHPLAAWERPPVQPGR